MAFRKPTCRWRAEGYSQVSFKAATKQRTLAPGFQAIHDDLFDILYKVHSVTQSINPVNPPKLEVIPLRLRERIRSIQYYLLSSENHNDISGLGDQLLKACRLGVLLYVGII